ncbi:MAG: hypothetical protein ACR2GU_06800 [Rubrobacteraceae bacterium]
MQREVLQQVAIPVEKPREALVSLLIPTHALPPFSYRIPGRLAARVGVGSTVVVPLSGYSRLGVVIRTEGDAGGKATEDIREVLGGLSPGARITELCGWVSEAAAIPLPSVLRSALTPGLLVGRYRITEPAPGWTWRKGDIVGRRVLRDALGGEGLKTAEAAERIELAPAPPEQRKVEWAVSEEATPDLGRAYRQRALLEEIQRHGAGCTVSSLLRETGANRATLKQLVRRGAARLEKRPDPAPIFPTRGKADHLGDPFSWNAERVLDSGGAWLWRLPSGDQAEAVLAVAREAVERGRQALILAPEIEAVEVLVRNLRRALPADHTVAPCHSGLGRNRIPVYRAAREGTLDVLVGTRAAALLPLARPGVICIVDEPNESHRAAPGYEGVPIHTREISLERAGIDGSGVLFLSPTPSLQLYARSDLKELPARTCPDRPAARIIDMRGSGAALSSTLLDACRQGVEGHDRVGVISNRLGYATAVSCNRCGAVSSCPNCDLPFTLHRETNLLVCARCGRREQADGSCNICGSERMTPTGLAVERVREDISTALDIPVGLLTADSIEQEDARIVVGTARYILNREWDIIAVPDADSYLLGSSVGAVERAFRLLYRATEAARMRLLVQTRAPEHYALQAALRGDYPSFASAELSRRRSLRYPPYTHMASLRLRGNEESVRLAVESGLRPVLEKTVEMSNPVPLGRSGTQMLWRVLIKSHERPAVARAASLSARTIARGDSKLKVQVEIDPEEV